MPLRRYRACNRRMWWKLDDHDSQLCDGCKNAKAKWSSLFFLQSKVAPHRQQGTRPLAGKVLDCGASVAIPGACCFGPLSSDMSPGTLGGTCRLPDRRDARGSVRVRGGGRGQEGGTVPRAGREELGPGAGFFPCCRRPTAMPSSSLTKHVLAHSHTHFLTAILHHS